MCIGNFSESVCSISPFSVNGDEDMLTKLSSESDSSPLEGRLYGGRN